MKVTTATFRKGKGEKRFVCLTAYDTLTAHLADQAGADLLLVGDSVGNTVLGFETTVPVTLDMIVHHCAAVARAKPNAMIVADLPFATQHHSMDVLLGASVRCLQEGGAEAVKLEGGKALAPKVAALVDAGVPVMGHIGLMPQRIHALGNYRSYGRTKAGKTRLKDDALALQDAGAFAVLGEAIDTGLMAELTEMLKVPTIGIGCGPHCDGQILVSTDVLGLGNGKYPAFTKQYANLNKTVLNAFSAYAAEVRDGSFPEEPKKPAS